MHVGRLKQQDFDAFLEFNKRVFPDRQDVEARFRFQVADNPLNGDPDGSHIIIARADDGRLVGQFVIYPGRYLYNGRILPCYWGCDLFVLEAYRQEGAGFLVPFKAINSFKPHFTIDVSETVRKMYSSFHARTIGGLHKFIWLKNLSVPLRGLGRFTLRKKGGKPEVKELSSEFPANLHIGDDVFEMTNSFANSAPQPWHEDILEFSRSSDFLNRRFFQNFDSYRAYRLHGTDNSYFVVREAYWRELNLIALVDYRVPFTDSQAFEAILNACKSIVNAGSRDGIITMSSHAFFDQNLKEAGFFKMGKPALILTNAREDFPEDRVEERNLVFATMADGDIDFNYYRAYS